MQCFNHIQRGVGETGISEQHLCGGRYQPSSLLSQWR